MPAAKIKNNVKIAFSAVISALSVVVMILAGIIPTATVALPALAGCLLIPVVAELGEKWGYISFVVVSVLSFFLTADKEAFLIYLLFFGYYPVLYSSFCKIKNKFLSYVIKIIVFNVAAIGDYFITTFIFGIPQESIALLGEYTVLVVLVLANIVFILFDYALKGLIREYFVRFHKLALKFLYN